MKKMEYSNLFNSSVRIKEEHNYASPIGNYHNYYKSFPLRNPSHRVRRCDGHRKIDLYKKEKIQCDKSEHNLQMRIDSAFNDTAHHACDICGQKFSHRSSLNRHARSLRNCLAHFGDLCEKVFSPKHHGDVRHKCDVCGKSFSRRASLKQHIDAKHNNVDSAHNEVKHVRRICEKSFAQKRYLKAHGDSVHQGTEHACDKCGKTFSQKSDLMRHVNSALAHARDPRGKVPKVSTASNATSSGETLIINAFRRLINKFFK